MIVHEKSRSLGGALVSAALLSAGVVMAYEHMAAPPPVHVPVERQLPGGAEDDAVVTALSSGADGSALRAIVARRDPAGGFVWRRTCTGSGAMSEPRTAVGTDGTVIVGLTFEGAIDCGAGPIVSAGGAGDFDALVLALDRRGEIRWTVPVSDLGSQAVAAVALDPWGSVLVAGSFEGTITLGGPPLAAETERDILLAKLDADGRFIWQRRFGGAAPSFGVDVDVTRSGRVLLLSRGAGDIDAVGSDRPPTGSAAFLSAMSPAGQPLWSRRFGGPGGDIHPARVRAIPGNQVLVTGTFTGTADLGAGVVSSAGRNDAFVIRLDAAGLPLGSARISDLLGRTPDTPSPEQPTSALALRGLLDDLTKTPVLPWSDTPLPRR